MPSYNRKNKNRRIRQTAARTSAQATRQEPLRSSRTKRKTIRSRARKRRATTGSAVKGARSRLKNFRQASMLAVAITGFMLLLFAPSEAGLVQDDGAGQATEQQDSVPVVGKVQLEEFTPADSPAAETAKAASSKEAAVEAIGALQGLWESFLYYLPKLLIAIVLLVLAWLLVRILRSILLRTIGHWQSSSAIISLVSIAAWMLAIGVALSVVAGDIRALVGSLGLIGLALSWSLQTPIECFTGWLMNSYQGYYRIGDRIRVGEVFGDVYNIDFLTTTVWEIGAPYQPGFVQAEQPTGRLVTFPNNEILTGTVINLTRDFPYVWDELDVSVANESDIPLTMRVLEGIALDLLGNYMKEPAKMYAELLQRAGLDDNVPDRPQIFLSADESWTNVTIRYLVGARERRKWKSELTLRLAQEMNKPEYREKIIPVYPRQQVQFINPDGVPVEAKLADAENRKR